MKVGLKAVSRDFAGLAPGTGVVDAPGQIGGLSQLDPCATSDVKAG